MALAGKGGVMPRFAWWLAAAVIRRRKPLPPLSCVVCGDPFFRGESDMFCSNWCWLRRHLSVRSPA